MRSVLRCSQTRRGGGSEHQGAEAVRCGLEKCGKYGLGGTCVGENKVSLP